MTPQEAMERINIVLAHAWMVRTFLKHASEVEDDAQMLAVQRTIVAYVRVLEPSYERMDADEYLRRAGIKLPKLRRAAAYLEDEYRGVSDHPNFELAARSLSGCVQAIEEILAAVPATAEPTASPPAKLSRKDRGTNP
jgi:hypothetical protein